MNAMKHQITLTALLILALATAPAQTAQPQQGEQTVQNVLY